jgi:hypothetical protein
MEEVVEFRIFESQARKMLPDDVGEPLGIVRWLLTRRDDPLFEKIGQLEGQYRSNGTFFIASWKVRRTYTAQEIRQAELMSLRIRRIFEPAGEELGTQYDEGRACKACGSGAPQTSPLRLRRARIPRGSDLAMTIAGEMVASRRLVDLCRRAEFTGVSFASVEWDGGTADSTQDPMQLLVPRPSADLHVSTVCGEVPFDVQSSGRCRGCRLAGLNLLSTTNVTRASWRGDDLVATVDLVGARRGLLRPSPILLLSPRLWRHMEDAGMKGVEAEVARLV